MLSATPNGQAAMAAEADASGYSISVARSTGDFAGLAKVWQQLEPGTPDPYCYFQTWEWCSAWNDQYGATVEPYILTLH